MSGSLSEIVGKIVAIVSGIHAIWRKVLRNAERSRLMERNSREEKI